MSAQTTKGDSANRGNTGGSIQMDLSGFLSAEGSRRIDWTAPLRASQGDNVPTDTFLFHCIAVTGGSARGPNSGQESHESIHSRWGF